MRETMFIRFSRPICLAFIRARSWAIRRWCGWYYRPPTVRKFYSTMKRTMKTNRHKFKSYTVIDEIRSDAYDAIMLVKMRKQMKQMKKIVLDCDCTNSYLYSRLYCRRNSYHRSAAVRVCMHQ